jgi:hypothetical protein
VHTIQALQPVLDSRGVISEHVRNDPGIELLALNRSCGKQRLGLKSFESAAPSLCGRLHSQTRDDNVARAMKAIGYVRVSTDKQAETGVPLEARAGKIRAMGCTARNCST